MLRRLILVIALIIAIGTGTAYGQAYPSRPIKIIAPFPAGSATDVLARTIGARLSKTFGQAVLIDNRPGANGFIASQEVARAPADGYTLLVTTGSTHAANPALFKRLPYDPVKDFTPVSTIASSYLVLVAAPGLSANTPRDLAAQARISPKKLSFASGNTLTRIAGEMFKMMAEVELLHIPYRGTPQALTDVMAGEISVMWTDLLTGIPLIEAGRVKALALTSPQRLKVTPHIPTMVESGFQDYVLSAWVGIYAPAHLDKEIVDRLNQAIHSAVKAERETLEKYGLETFLTSPTDFAKLQQRDAAMWQRVTKSAGMVAE